VDDAQLLELALAEARQALAHGDVPVGALVVIDGDVIASRHNERQLRNDPTAHAETLALRDAAERLGTSHLVDATLVSTLEPCSMCAGAALLARVKRVVFGAADMKTGACGSLYNFGADPRLGHEYEVRDLRSTEAGDLVRAFFAEKR